MAAPNGRSTDLQTMQGDRERAEIAGGMVGGRGRQKEWLGCGVARQREKRVGSARVGEKNRSLIVAMGGRELSGRWKLAGEASLGGCRRRSEDEGGRESLHGREESVADSGDGRERVVRKIPSQGERSVVMAGLDSIAGQREKGADGGRRAGNGSGRWKLAGEASSGGRDRRSAGREASYDGWVRFRWRIEGEGH